MRQTLLLVLGIIGLNASAQHHWSIAEVTDIFDLAYSASPSAAVAALESQDVTAYDFGMDLVAMGQLEQARNWYDLMILAGGDIQPYLFGKAWVQKDQGDVQSAMVTANQLLSLAGTDLTRARAHYLLGVILKQVGSHELANQKLEAAQSAYILLNKPGGVANCQNAMASQSKTATYARKSVTHPPPPRDDTDS